MKRQKNQGNAALIVLLIIIVVVVGVVAAVLIIRNNRKYTPGEMVGNTYVNKWAKVKVEVPDSYTYQTNIKKTNGYEVPFALLATDGLSYCYVFTREGETKVENLETEFRKMFGDGNMGFSFGKVGVQMSVSTDHRVIAGESYDCLVMSAAGVRFVFAYRTVYDNGIFVICTATAGGVYEDDIFKLFEKY